MKFYLLIIAALLFSFSSALTTEEIEDLNSEVLVFDGDNFDEEIVKHEIIMVEFYAPWCGHCKALAPEYEKAAKALKESGLSLAKVNADAEKNRPLAQRFGIRGFPTIKMFRKGEYLSEYEGIRSGDAIINYMQKLSRPAITQLESAEAAIEFKESDKVVVIGFFENSVDEVFEKAANTLRVSFSFGSVVGKPEIAKALEAGQNAVVLFKKFDERVVALASLPSVEDLQAWIKASGTPTISEIGPDNYGEFMQSGLPLVWVFVDPKVQGQLEKVLNDYRPVAKETKGKLNWVWVDWGKYARQTERVGLSGKVVPAIAIDNFQTGKHYGREAELGQEAIKEWVSSYLDGSLEPTVRSEDVPEENNGPVKKVVAKSFDSMVLNSGKDVLMEFYAPWCGHCKNLAPIYEELGEFFEKEEGIVIAQMDATANDVNPAYGVRGFPTIKLFQAGNPTPLDYSGDRTLENLKEFVIANRKQ